MSSQVKVEQKQYEVKSIQLPHQPNRVFSHQDIFKTDHLPAFLTTKDAETNYRVKAQYIRDLIWSHKKNNRRLPFIILYRGQTILIQRYSFELWLLNQSNALMPATPTATPAVVMGGAA